VLASVDQADVKPAPHYKILRRLPDNPDASTTERQRPSEKKDYFGEYQPLRDVTTYQQILNPWRP